MLTQGCCGRGGRPGGLCFFKRLFVNTAPAILQDDFGPAMAQQLRYNEAVWTVAGRRGCRVGDRAGGVYCTVMLRWGGKMKVQPWSRRREHLHCATLENILNYIYWNIFKHIQY